MSRAVVPFLTGTEYVTSTRRQAVELARAHGRGLEARGVAVWQTPRLLPLETALAATYALLDGERPALLGDGAALRLWRRIVEASGAGPGLLDSRAAARAARRAYSLAGAWAIDLGLVEGATADQAAFLDWAAQYRAFLDRQGRVDRADLGAILRAAPLPAGAWPLELVDGGPLPRGTEALLRHWQGLGRPVGRRPPPDPGARVKATVYRSREDEWAACCDWLEARLDADPNAHLAVLWPGLANEAITRRRQLDERLYPDGLLNGTAGERPYALAPAPPLGQIGVVAAALAALRLARPTLEWQTLGRLLRSPYLEGGDAEAALRARADARLRREPALELGAADVERHVAGAPLFAAARRRLQAALAGPARRPLEAWAVAFGAALTAVGWPGPRPLQSDEHQAVVKFRSLLGELAALSAVLPAQTFAGACTELSDLAAAMEFQAEAGTPQITFLDGPAALGYPVDGLWVAGLEAARFPALAPPEPLLPLAAQRVAGVPAALARAARTEAERQLADWQGWADELVLSVATFDGDVAQRPSPVLAGFGPQEAAAAEPRRDWLAALAASRRVQPVPVDALPALAPGARIRGGTTTLGLQAACPFRAAFQSRLSVEALETPGGGVGARLRGDLAHQALARLWQGLGSSARLLALDRAGRERCVDEAVEAAVAELATRLPKGRLLRLERDWLRTALLRLLDVELARLPFTVEAIEADRAVEFDGHALKVKIDRLDRLADGATVLIDYKSGRRRPHAWDAERLTDVQLPLYAIHLDEAPAAVVTAHLANGKQTYAGVAIATGLLPDVRPPGPAAADGAAAYAALIALWRTRIAALAADFIAGRATVDPTPDACTYCPHALACRVARDPADRAVEADDGEGADGV